TQNLRNKPMNKDEIIRKVKELGLPKGSYVVFGSCPMAVAGIREAGDIDLLVLKEVFTKLRTAGWSEVIKSPNDKPLMFEDFEAHSNWGFSSYKPTLKHLLSTATIIDGIPFASLQEVRKWKAVSGRPKDIID